MRDQDRALRQRPPPRSGREAGFTLIEVLIAFAIVGASVVIAIPLLGTGASQQLLRSTASQLASGARLTRAAAVGGAGERALVLDLERRQWRIDGIAPPAAIPSRLTLEVSVPESERSGPAERRIRFLPSGGSSGGTIVLRDGSRQAVVVVDWLTGGARVTLAP